MSRKITLYYSYNHKRSLRFFILVHVFDSTFKTIISSMFVTNLVIEREREREREDLLTLHDQISHKNRQRNSFENEIKFSELK